MEMDTMKAVVYAARNRFELREVPVPELKKGQIKLQLEYCAICATDVHIVTQGLYNLPVGALLGHEASGTVIELGEEAERTGFAVGDKVAIWPRKVCGVCDPCRRGQPQFCQNEEHFATMAEFAVAEPCHLFKLPPDADLKTYALMEPTTCVVRAIDLAQINPGDTVALSGCGGIGALLLNLILLSGGAKVTVIDPMPAKRQLALSMGAQYTIDPVNEQIEQRTDEITGGRGFDFVFEASGAKKAAPPCLKIVARCGTIVYFAVYPMDYELPLNLYELYLKEAAIRTVFTDSKLIPRVLGLLPRLQTNRIIGKVMPLREAVEAIEVVFAQSKYAKILINCKEA
jgi:threonine dehydrogenase-like Zn-dependent dehydrogenase